MYDENTSRNSSAASQAVQGRPFSALAPALRSAVPWVVGLAVVGALAGWGHQKLTAKQIYEASAILVVVPPRFVSELSPPTYTIQGYREFLDSDAVIAETAGRLAERGFYPDDRGLLLARQLDSTIFTSRRSEETLLAPMLRLRARSSSGDRAAALANTWAEVFLERIHALALGTTSETVQFIDDQFPVARERLGEIENTGLAQAIDFERRRIAVLRRWQERLGRTRAEAAREKAELEVETQRLLSLFDIEHRLAARNASLVALRDLYAELQSEVARVGDRREAKQLEEAALAEVLAATPATLAVRKVISDDALWQAVLDSGNGTGMPAAVGERVLVSEEVNPVHVSLASQLATARTEGGALEPRSELLQRRIADLSTRLDELEAGLADDQAERNRLVRTREAMLLGLSEEQRIRIEGMEAEMEGELSSLAHESAHQSRQLEREIERQRKLFAELSERFNQAVIEKGQSDLEQVRLAAPAVPPRVPLRRGAGGKALAGLVLGGTLGLTFVLSRDSLRRRALGRSSSTERREEPEAIPDPRRSAPQSSG